MPTPSPWPSGAIVRDLHPKKNPDAIFQNLYLLAVIHIAQKHDDKAEPMLMRASTCKRR